MRHLFATISLLVLLGTGPAMAADGINSTGGELPMGAGGQTVSRIFSNGYVKFYDPTTLVETAWINSNNGSASFGVNAGGLNINYNQIWTNQGNLYLNHSNLSPVNINQSMNVNGNQIWTNSGDLYFNFSTTNDSNVVVGNNSKITNFQIINGSLNVGGTWINSSQLGKLVNMVNVFDNCADGETIVKSGPGYACQSPSGIKDIRIPDNGGNWAVAGSCPAGYSTLHYVYRPGGTNNTEYWLCIRT